MEIRIGAEELLSALQEREVEVAPQWLPPTPKAEASNQNNHPRVELRQVASTQAGLKKFHQSAASGGSTLPVCLEAMLLSCPVLLLFVRPASLVFIKFI